MTDETIELMRKRGELIEGLKGLAKQIRVTIEDPACGWDNQSLERLLIIESKVLGMVEKLEGQNVSLRNGTHEQAEGEDGESHHGDEGKGILGPDSE